MAKRNGALAFRGPDPSRYRFKPIRCSSIAQNSTAASG
jgi:hypothetical protein